MALTRVAGNWWDRSIPVMYDDSGGITSDMLSGGIASELLTTNVTRRSVICQVPTLAAGTTNPLTSAFSVWSPSVPVRLQSWSLISQTSWVQTTLQTTPVGTLYAGAGSAVGTVAIPTTNAPTRGSVLSGSLSSAYSVPNGTILTFGLTVATSSGMVQPNMALQLDFDTTG